MKLVLLSNCNWRRKSDEETLGNGSIAAMMKSFRKHGKFGYVHLKNDYLNGEMVYRNDCPVSCNQPS